MTPTDPQGDTLLFSLLSHLKKINSCFNASHNFGVLGRVSQTAGHV